MLTRDQVRQKTDRAVEEFEVPEWGGSVTLRALSLKQRRQLTTLAKGGGEGADDETITRLTVAMALVDPSDRQPIYDPDKPEDLAALSEQDSVALTRIFNRVLERSGVTKAAAEATAKN